MKKQNKYTEIKDKIKEASKNSELSDNERLLARDVFTLMEVDKLAKLSEWSINNDYLHSLENSINQAINGYEIHLDNLINGDHKIIHISDYLETKDKINRLKNLNEEVNLYKESLLEPFYNKTEELFDECCERIGLSTGALRLLNVHEKINNIDLYEALENNQVINDLKRCLNFEREKRKNRRIMELCDGILSRRNTLRENVDKIVKHNSLNEELMSSIGTKSTEELKAMKEEIIESNKKLMNSGLGDVLFGLNTNLKLALNRSNTPLFKYLQDVKDESDLIEYIAEIKELRENIDKYMKRTFIFEEKYLLNTANPIAIDIATTDSEIAKELINIVEDDNLSIKSLLAEALLVMQTSNLEDMDVDDKEVNNINKHFAKKTKSKSQELFERYNDIISEDMAYKVEEVQKTK